MKKLLLRCLVLLFINSGLLAQSDLETYLRVHHIETHKTEDGLLYRIQQPGTGKATPKEGDYAVITYAAMLPDSTIFDQARADDPLVFQLGNREVIRGLDKGVRLLRKGGQATLYIPPALGYRQHGAGRAVPPNSSLIYSVQLLDIMSFEAYDRYMRNLEEREKEAFEQKKKESHTAQLQRLDEYATAKGWQVKKTPSGLGYVLSHPGIGPRLKPGNQVTIEYEGYTLDGKPFDKSDKPFVFTLGGAKVIQGWEEGLPFFSPGGEGWLLIPSSLAYGPVQVRDLPPYSALVFRVKVLSVR